MIAICLDSNAKFSTKVVLQFYTAFHPSKHFWIYWDLPLACFALDFLVPVLACASHFTL